MLRYTLDFSKQQINISTEFLNNIENLPLFKYLECDFLPEQYQEALQKLEKFTHIIHLGTGGSSLGPQALYAIADTPAKTFVFFDNNSSGKIAKRHPRLYVNYISVFQVTKTVQALPALFNIK